MEGWNVVWGKEAMRQRMELIGVHPRFGGWIREILRSLDLESGPLFQDVPEGFGICVFRDEWGEELRIRSRVDFAARSFHLERIEVKSRTLKYWAPAPRPLSAKAV